jgi:hypothetical protein
VYDMVKAEMKKYLEFESEAQYGLITAWILMTYFHRCFNAVPYFFFYGKKGTGKSRCLDLLERLSFNANKTQGVSVASLADTVDGIRGAFLFDQAESLSNSKNEGILGILADSYTVGGGKRRIVDISNNSRRVVEFSAFGPKAFASIKPLDADLMDRCIEIRMLKTKSDYPYPEAHFQRWGEIRDQLYRLLLTGWKEAREIYRTAGEGTTQRVKELWKPIDTMLKLENVPKEEQERVYNAFKASMEETQSELSEQEHELFEVLERLMTGSSEEKELSVSDISEEWIQEYLNQEDLFDVHENTETKKIEHLFRSKKLYFKTRKGMETWIGKALKQLSLYIGHTKRKKGRRAYRFNCAQINDIFMRYGGNSGFSGQVVNHPETKDLQATTQKRAVVTGGQVVPTTVPPVTTSKNEVVNPKSLQDKDNDHITTETTEPDRQGNFVNLENEKVELENEI